MNNEEKERARRIESDESYGLDGTTVQPPFDGEFTGARLTVRFPFSDLDQMDPACQRMGIGRSNLVRIAMREWIENHPDLVRPLEEAATISPVRE